MVKFKQAVAAAAVLIFLTQTSCEKKTTAGFDKPTGIYINWAAYDELSDTVKLDESIAARQGLSLGHVLIIRAQQNSHDVPVKIHYDKSIWSGLLWAAG